MHDFYTKEFNIGNMLPNAPLTSNNISIISDDYEKKTNLYFENNVLKRKSLPNNCFGIPSLRKYPMPDKKHTISAIKLFNHVDTDYEEELATNILKNVEKYNIDLGFVGDKNRFKKYLETNNSLYNNETVNKKGGYSMKENTMDSILSCVYNKYFTATESNKEHTIKKVPDKIEEVVKILERKGYKVKYSSPGYSNSSFKNDRNKDGIISGKFVSTAKLIFDEDYTFHSLPKKWEFKYVDDGNKALYVKPLTYNKDKGSPKEEYNKWRESYMYELKKWVNELPYKDKIDKDEKVEEIKESGNMPDYRPAISLYHGSCGKYDSLEPKKATHGIPYVYGTPDYNFALCYAGNPWNDFEINQSYYNGKLYLTEIKPNMFKKIFDRDGYIYRVMSNNFSLLDKNAIKDKEYISTKKVSPVSRDYIPNIYKKIKESDIKVYTYPNLPPFIDSREDYIKNKANYLYSMTGDKGVMDYVKREFPDIYLDGEML